MAANHVIRAENVCMNFSAPAGELSVLKNLNMEIKPGEVVAITGRSGAGKSTLLHILGGLQAPSSGKILLNNQDLYSLAEAEQAKMRSRYFGFVFQAHHLLPGFTALENVILPAQLAGKSTEQARSLAAELLEGFGLADRGAHLPAELSGGECQRVSLARAMINTPSLLLADEPTGNLDLQNANRVLDSLTTVVRDVGGSILIVTHDSRVTGIADRVLELGGGQING